MSRAARKKYAIANPQLARAMAELRRSSAAQPHLDRHTQRRKGHHARGGRAGAKAWLRKALSSP